MSLSVDQCVQFLEIFTITNSPSKKSQPGKKTSRVLGSSSATGGWITSVSLTILQTIAQSLPHKDNRLVKEKNGCQATLGESVVTLSNYPSKISIPVSHGPWNKFLRRCKTDFNILVKVKAENKF